MLFIRVSVYILYSIKAINYYLGVMGGHIGGWASSYYNSYNCYNGCNYYNYYNYYSYYGGWGAS